jgi:hypothetical protein
MSKFELTKTIEARRLNPRTGIPTSDPLVPIPFGAVVEDAVVDRDVRKFRFCGERFQCSEELFQVATKPLADEEQPAKANRRKAPVAANGGSPAPEAQPDEAADEEPAVVWERLSSNWQRVMRAEVPGGWLVALANATAVTFFPDPHHRWRDTSAR